MQRQWAGLAGKRTKREMLRGARGLVPAGQRHHHRAVELSPPRRPRPTTREFFVRMISLTNVIDGCQ